MIKITRGGFAADAARFATHVTAPDAARLQGTGVPTAASGTDAFGPAWRLRGKRVTAEHDSAPPA